MPRTQRRAGRGTLSIISGLLIASAIVRVGAEAGPALANEAAGETNPIEEASEDKLEIDALLVAFQEREALLSEREKQLRDRIQALDVAGAEIEQQLTALIAAEEALAATIAMADEAAATDLDQLTNVYENMKPKEAAALFEEMPPEFAAGFLGMMRPDAAALIMTQLEPEVAYSFSIHSLV